MLIPGEGDTQVLDRPASLQQGTRRFSALYERNAYLIYNLTLRITCDRPTAIVAASASFLAAGKSADDEAGLVKTATSQALAIAADRMAEPHGAGDAEAEAMLAATAGLTAPGRAALALNGLAEAGPAQIAAMMNLTEQAATGLLERSFEGLARNLGSGRTEAEDAYRGWLWAEPPAELWEDLYPSFYRLLERQLGEAEGALAGGGAAKSKKKGPSRRERRQMKRAKAQQAALVTAGDAPRKRWRPRRRTLWAVALLALGGGAFAAASGSGLIGGSDTPPPEQPLAPEASFGGNLSPDKLDELRLRELERAAGADAADDDPDAKDDPDDPKGRKRALRRKQAKQEILELRRRRAKRKRELRERDSQTARTPPPAPPRDPEPRPNSGGDKKPSKDEPKDDGPSREECLYNAGNGTYVCPD